MRWMAETGIPMIAGSDAGATQAAFDGFANTLEFYAYLGIPNPQIIDMATIDAARALGIASETGRIAEGYRADLLVVDGNPLDDLGALRAVRQVVAVRRLIHP